MLTPKKEFKKRRNLYIFGFKNFKKYKSKKTSCIDHKAYVFYKDNSKYGTRDNVAHFVEYGTLISEFYKIASEMFLDDPDGMYLDYLGYFGFACVEKMDYKVNFVTKQKIIADYYIFKPLFVPKMSSFRPYIADSWFAKKIKDGMIKRLKNREVPYTFNPNFF
jgi:hypothetical protein